MIGGIISEKNLRADSQHSTIDGVASESSRRRSPVVEWSFTTGRSLSAATPKILHWSLIIFFFLLPLQTRYIFREVPLYEYGTLSIFLVEVLGWAVIVLGFLLRQNAKVKMQNVKWFALLSIFAFLSIAWAADKMIALQAALRLLEGILFYV